MMARIFVALMVLSAAAHPAEAAKKMKKAAKKHFDKGSKLFEKKDYADAAKEFEAAYGAEPRSEFLYTKGQAERMGGNCEAAIVTYERYLATKDPPFARHAQENIKRCKEELASAKPVAEPKPEPVAEPKPEPVAEPEPKPDPVPEPTPVVTEPAPEPGPEPSQSERPPFYRDWLGNALTIGGVIIGGTGTFLWVSGRADAQDANDAVDLQAHRDNADGAETRQWIGVGAMVAGGALVGGGIIRYMTRPAPERTSVTVLPTGDGAAVVIGGQF